MSLAWKQRVCGCLGFCGCLAVMVCVAVGPVRAQRVENPVAVFAGLDKITGEVQTFEVELNTSYVFGVLQVTPRVCYTRPSIETPQTTSFVEVVELRTNSSARRIFTGWMLAQSPGLNAVEHPVYDVWLTNCNTVSPSPSSTNE